MTKRNDFYLSPGLPSHEEPYTPEACECCGNHAQNYCQTHNFEYCEDCACPMCEEEER